MFLDRINEDLKTAMKSGDKFAVGVLRFVISALKNKSIEKRGKGQIEELSDEEALEVLSREMKKRKEAVELYKNGGRADLAEKEEKETEVIKKYLPEQLNEADVTQKVDEIISSLQDKSFGPAMKAVMRELRGKADSKIITEAVKKKLGV